MKTKELIISIIFIVVSLTTYRLFPVEGVFQQIFSTLIFFLILPLLFYKYILKKDIAELGISFFNKKQGIIWSVYSLIATFIVFFFIAKYSTFLNQYTVPVYITQKFINFLLYEFGFVFPFVFLYEFYFRGFILVIFKEKFKYWAVILQALLFLVLVLIGKEKEMIQIAPYLIFSPLAGIIAYKSRSIFYSGVSQFVVIFVLNLIIIKRLG